MVETKKQDEQGVNLGDIDEFLKQLIVNHWDSALKYSIEGDLKKAFLSYKALFSIIEPYEFTTKEDLRELTNSLQDYFDQITLQVITEAERVKVGQTIYSIRELLDIYQTELPKAYKELNLWLKSIVKYPDIDSQFSFETFNSDISTLKAKKEELLKALDLKTAFKFMSRQAIHDLHSRYRWNVAFGDKEGEINGRNKK